MKKKYIKEFRLTGELEVFTDLVCEDWDSGFSLLLWKNQKETRYTLLKIGGSKTPELESIISEEQALEMIERLKLLNVKGSIFSSGSSFHTRKYIEIKIEEFYEKLQGIKQQKAFLEGILEKYNKALGVV